MSGTGFLRVPEPSDDAQKLFDEDMAELGFVMNASHLWAYQPALLNGLFGLLRQTCDVHRLSVRDRGILVAATAAELGDSYCALAWGTKLAAASSPEVAAGVLTGVDEWLSPAERALAGWARKVVRDPNGIGPADVRALRDAGFADDQIFAITAFVALRLAFSTINDAVGAQPDAEYRALAPPAVLAAVTFGRPIEDE